MNIAEYRSELSFQHGLQLGLEKFAALLGSAHTPKNLQKKAGWSGDGHPDVPGSEYLERGLYSYKGKGIPEVINKLKADKRHKTLEVENSDGSFSTIRSQNSKMPLAKKYDLSKAETIYFGSRE